MTQKRESQCHIQLIGGLGISCNGEPPPGAKRPSPRTFAALAYLLLKRGKSVPTDEMVRVVGTGTDGDYNINALKILIYRLRRILADGSRVGLACIQTRTTSYAWDMSNGISVDLFEAEALFEKVTLAKHVYNLSPAEITGLLDLFGRELLPQMRDDFWIATARMRFRNMRESAMAQLLELMWQAGNVEQVALTCRRGLTSDPSSDLLWDHLHRAQKANARRYVVGTDASR